MAPCLWASIQAGDLFSPWIEDLIPHEDVAEAVSTWGLAGITNIKLYAM